MKINFFLIYNHETKIREFGCVFGIPKIAITRSNEVQN